MPIGKAVCLVELSATVSRMVCIVHKEDWERQRVSEQFSGLPASLFDCEVCSLFHSTSVEASSPRALTFENGFVFLPDKKGGT